MEEKTGLIEYDNDKLQETIFAIENEIKRLRKENIID